MVFIKWVFCSCHSFSLLFFLCSRCFQSRTLQWFSQSYCSLRCCQVGRNQPEGQGVSSAGAGNLTWMATRLFFLTNQTLRWRHAGRVWTQNYVSDFSDLIGWLENAQSQTKQTHAATCKLDFFFLCVLCFFIEQIFSELKRMHWIRPDRWNF